jgi:hypothetical protein
MKRNGKDEDTFPRAWYLALCQIALERSILFHYLDLIITTECHNANVIITHTRLYKYISLSLFFYCRSCFIYSLILSFFLSRLFFSSACFPPFASNSASQRNVDNALLNPLHSDHIRQHASPSSL